MLDKKEEDKVINILKIRCFEIAVVNPFLKTFIHFLLCTFLCAFIDNSFFRNSCRVQTIIFGFFGSILLYIVYYNFKIGLDKAEMFVKSTYMDSLRNRIKCKRYYKALNDAAKAIETSNNFKFAIIPALIYVFILMLPIVRLFKIGGPIL